MCGEILWQTDYGYKYVEGYVAQSEFSSPMYIYITIGGLSEGVAACRYPKHDKLVGIDHLLLHNSDNI